MYSLVMTSKRHHLNLMVADHHKSRAMLISRQCERCTRREYSRRIAGEYSRQSEIALTEAGYQCHFDITMLYCLVTEAQDAA